MRENWLKLAWLSSLFAVLVGCRSSAPELKPPKMAEEYRLPPEEKRYSEYVNYPKDTLYQSPHKKGGSTQGGMPTAGFGPRGGGGLGGF